MAKKNNAFNETIPRDQNQVSRCFVVVSRGGFYETFGADAVRAAEILNITLTARNNGGDQTELAGFPHHALNTYLPKLVMAGCHVAICDQLEDPKQTKTIVKRGVTELVTPG